MCLSVRHGQSGSLVLVAALTIFVSSSPAQAQQSLQINATGTVPSACTITSAAPFGTPTLSASGNVGATATVNCNAGFKVNALSSNGALKNSTAATSPFVNILVYNLFVSVPLETGSPKTASCASGTLVAGQSSCALSPANSTGLSSGGVASINKTATLTLSWTLPALPTRLIAGSYSDTITLTVAAVP